MSQSMRIIEFGRKEIQDQETYAIFLSAMTGLFIGSGLERRLKSHKIDKDHPVWPFLEKFLKENYNITLSDYLPAPQSGDEA